MSEDAHISIAEYTIPTQTFYRRACLADFFDEGDEKNNENTNNKHNKNYSHNNDNISKNQQEFGHRKRIKP
jgi:hypothetical protein